MAEEQCRNCGNRLPEGAWFCTACGTRVDQQTAQEPGRTPPGGATPPPGWTPPPGGATPPPGWTSQPTPPYGNPPYAYAGYDPYAGFWRRFAAIFLDGIILGIATNIVLYGVFRAAFGLGEAGRDAVDFFLSVIVAWVYFTVMESSSNQATVGKMALGIKVTDLDGRRISWARANARFWSKFLSYVTLMIGFMMAGFTQKKQGLHDIIGGTLVVKKNQ